MRAFFNGFLVLQSSSEIVVRSQIVCRKTGESKRRNFLIFLTPLGRTRDGEKKIQKETTPHKRQLGRFIIKYKIDQKLNFSK
jgi:hypothetical protein